MKSVSSPGTPIRRNAVFSDIANADTPKLQVANNTLTNAYESYARDLKLYLRKSFGAGPPDPEDMTQAAFQKLAEQDLSRIHNLKAFLWKTARNLTLTEKRNRDIRLRYDFEIKHLFFASTSPDSNPQKVLEIRQQLKIIDEALDRMPEVRKRAFLLNRVDGLNFSAIGRQMGLSPRAVVKHVSRAFTELEDALIAAGSQDR